ncbi:MAG: malto-oligosyltrehalose trehalohydrolase [Verrucomicrobiota bacterium]|nr:malto-oligosyltrehalose trehalohydrolase [Verrucomicrobiota bacterium]
MTGKDHELLLQPDTPNQVPQRLRSQGADVVEGGVRYRTWCKHDRADALVVDPSGTIIRVVPLSPQGDGYFSGLDASGAAGDLYQYRFGDSQGWPDPASRFQPLGVHGPSMVVDPGQYQWGDGTWTPPPFSELIIYELHVGTFTPEGTYRGAIARLDHLVALGVTALELMPLGDFPGDRNWGYDGVMPYAPARAYGEPDDLRALVDAAHAHRLAVILDVVYNHLGPDGNYTGVYHADYTNPKLHTPWGAALNYAAAPVRAFFVENAPYWMREFHIDGFRLDATHEIVDKSPRHILAEIGEEIHSLGGFVVAEDERNAPELLQPTSRGGLGLDGCWADDFHHVINVALTRNQEGYFANYKGTPHELVETLTHGWLYRGQMQPANGKARGADPADAHAQQFIYCISNHDQVGNRAFGERLGHLTSPAAYRAASAFLCLVPQTPMLFMGQEWNASTPFQFFTDHNPELGKLVTEGRRREFSNFHAFRDANIRAAIPDPQAEQTFAASTLRWEELREEKHAQALLLYQEFIGLRRTHPSLQNRARDNWLAVDLEDGIIALFFGAPGRYDLAVLLDLIGGHSSPNLDEPRLTPGEGRDWQRVISSNEERFGGSVEDEFREPATLVLEAI